MDVARLQKDLLRLRGMVANAPRKPSRTWWDDVKMVASDLWSAVKDVADDLGFSLKDVVHMML